MKIQAPRLKILICVMHVEECGIMLPPQLLITPEIFVVLDVS